MCLCFYVFKFIILSRSDKIYKLLYFTKADLCMNLWSRRPEGFWCKNELNVPKSWLNQKTAHYPTLLSNIVTFKK
jgi:hypothetical protein